MVQPGATAAQRGAGKVSLHLLKSHRERFLAKSEQGGNDTTSSQPVVVLGAHVPKAFSSCSPEQGEAGWV